MIVSNSLMNSPWSLLQTSLLHLHKAYSITREMQYLITIHLAAFVWYAIAIQHRNVMGVLLCPLSLLLQPLTITLDHKL